MYEEQQHILHDAPLYCKLLAIPLMEEVKPSSDTKASPLNGLDALNSSTSAPCLTEGAASGATSNQAVAIEAASGNKRPRREVKTVSYKESDAVDDDANDEIKRIKSGEVISNQASSVETGSNGASETSFRAQHRRRQYCDPVVGDRVLKYFGGFGRYEGTIVSVRGPVPQPMKSTAASAASSAASNAASAATADGGVSSDAADSKSASEPPLGATAPNPDAQRTTKSDAAVDVASSRAAAAVSPGGKTSNSSADGSEENNSTERSLANTPEGSSSSSNARKLWLVVFDDGDAEEYELSDCAQLVRWHSDRDDFEDYVLAHHYGRGGNGSYGRSNGGSYGGRGPKASRLDALSVDAALSLKTTPIFLKQENPKKLNTKSWKRYEIYKAATTVEEYLSLGGLKADVKFDYQRSYLAVVDLATGNKQWVERTEGPNGEDLSEGANEDGSSRHDENGGNNQGSGGSGGGEGTGPGNGGAGNLESAAVTTTTAPPQGS